MLDEATSSLEPIDTAAAINATIERLAQQCTVIAITHVLASLANADKIYVLNDGRVVEEGTHDSLLFQSGCMHSPGDRRRIKGKV